jgi:hypothetical protein
MAHRNPDSTDNSFIFDLVLAAGGAAATGLTYADLDLTYCRVGSAPAAKVDAVELALVSTAHTDNGAIELDSTYQPGAYRVDFPDAAFAIGKSTVRLTVTSATTTPKHIDVDLFYAPTAAEIAAIKSVADTISTAVVTTIPGTITTLQGNVTDILTDTGTTLDTAVGAVKTVVDTISTAVVTTIPGTISAVKTVADTVSTAVVTTIPGTITTMQGNVTDILTDTGTTLDTAVGAVKTVVDAILLDTATLPTDPADESNVLAQIALVKAKTDNIIQKGVSYTYTNGLTAEVAVVTVTATP